MQMREFGFGFGFGLGEVDERFYQAAPSVRYKIAWFYDFNRTCMKF